MDDIRFFSFIKIKVNKCLITLCTAALLCFITHAQSQDQTTQSAVSSEAIARAYELRSANPAKARQLINEVKRASLSNEQKDRYDIVQAYLVFMEGDIKGAIDAFKAIAKDAYTFESRFSANAALVSLYAGTQNWTEGFKALDFVKENVMKIDSVIAEEQAHFAVINFFGQIDEGVTLAQYLRPLLNGRYSQRFECVAQMQLLGYALTSDSSAMTTEMFEEARAFCELAGEGLVMLNIDNQLADFYFKQGQTEQTLSILLANFDAIMAKKYKPLADEANMLLTQAYFAIDDHDSAEKYAHLILQGKGDVNLVSRADFVAYDILYRIAELKGDFAQALQLHKKYTEAKSLNINRENAKLLAIQKARQDSEQQSNEIAVLGFENSLLRAQADLDKESANNRLLIIAFMLMILFFIAIWIYRKQVNYRKIQKISQTDSLTGIANRGFFTSSAQASIQKCAEQNIPISLILFDLDNFKRINDTFGHAVGDRALITAVDAAKLGCRTNDLIGRLGGEEFGIILEGCHADKASAIAEACRTQIHNTNSNEHQQYHLNASFGVASSQASDYDFDTLFDKADSALYDAKHSGKNKVVCFANK